MSKIEILAPAGTMDSIIAAVRCGADAVYLGAKDFSARAAAKNFDIDELKQAIDYCHIRGVKVHLTVNTLIFDDELMSALELVKNAALFGIDALIVQDFGFAMMVHKMLPQLPLHGSTQMSIHNLAGAMALYEQGFTRVVLSREMSKDEIINVVENCPIETEVFVHGALCMCVSGQCYFSAMLGSRSGNRGACAQPCRLPFKVKNGNGFALSLKDNSIVKELKDLEKIGVTSAKIEGRMKRPEYVACAVQACKQSRDYGAVSQKAAENLANVFSRTGFTNGYYANKRGIDMFGTRQKDDVLSAGAKFLNEIKVSYKDETPIVPVTIDFNAKIGQHPTLTVSDGENSAFVCDEEITCEKAVNVPLSSEKCINQLNKTGGTPYYCTNTICKLDTNVTLPVSTINSLRRRALTKLDSLREKNNCINITEVNDVSQELEAYLLSKPTIPNKPALRARFVNQEIPADYSACEYVFVPLSTPIEKIKQLSDRGINVAVEIPRGMFGTENQVKNKLSAVKEAGITHVLANNLGAVYIAKALGFTVHGGFGLNIVNTASLVWAEKLGIEDVELSFEMTIEQISMLGGTISRGVISYGYLPLMLTRNCPNKNGGNSCNSCKKDIKLQDRMNVKFPMCCDGNCVEILNSLPLLMPQKIYNKNAINFEVFRFSVENYVENVENIRSFHSKTLEKSKFTNGLYYRGVK